MASDPFLFPVYDGWNVIMVLDGLNSNAVTRKYTWGLDLSSTIHGAGGIGGLLACEEPQATGGPKRYWFMYDANGNVGQVLDATDTNSITIAAHYEYDPYGNVINNLSSYTYATANPIRFSTKWFDAETGLGYWGYRYYSPRLGRWISRDPIEERGGLNIFAFVENDPLDACDSLGRQKMCKWSGSISGSTWAMMLGSWAKVSVNATGVDDEGTSYAVYGTGSKNIGSGALFGLGYFSASVDFENLEAPCMWPVTDGDTGMVAIIGAGATVGAKISMAYIRGEAGKLKGNGGPFQVGGCNLFFAGGGWSVPLKVTLTGPTPHPKP